MTTHTVSCLCGLSLPVDGWLSAVEIARLHSRKPGCEAVIDLQYTRRCPCGLKERPGSCGWCEE